MSYENILLIDDDTEDHEIFVSALRMISDTIQCVALTNAQEALVQLDNRDLNPDVIFLDLNMPVMSGQEFLKRIKSNEALNSIPVIIYSTSSNPATIAATKKSGAVHFITKPGRFNDLVDLLKPVFN